MFIRATSQVNKKTGKSYQTHRLVEAYRNQGGKARQRTLLNLGAVFEIPKEHWKVLVDRIEEIIKGQKSLLEIEDALEKEAQRIAKIITHKFSEPDLLSQASPETDKSTTDFKLLTLTA